VILGDYPECMYLDVSTDNCDEFFGVEGELAFDLETGTITLPQKKDNGSCFITLELKSIDASIGHSSNIVLE